MIFDPILPIFIIIPLFIVLAVISFAHKKPLAPKSFVRTGIALCLALLLSRPMITGIEAETQALNLDVIFVVDTTLSMAAEDYSGEDTRLEAVKKDLETIVTTLAGARFSLITFNNYPSVVTPLSSDTMTLKREIASLKPENSYYARGTSLNDVKEPLEEILKSARTLQEESEDPRETVLFFIGDGEFTRKDERLSSFASFKPLLDLGYVLGYGTTSGGPMKGSSDDYYLDAQGYVQDTTSYPYQRGLSKINETTLKALADDLGADYIHAENHSTINTTAHTVANLAHESSRLSESASDIYFIFMIPLILLLIIEFIIDKRNLV